LNINLKNNFKKYNYDYIIQYFIYKLKLKISQILPNKNNNKERSVILGKHANKQTA